MNVSGYIPFGIPIIKRKKRNFDINTRVCYSMRRIGNAHHGLKTFLYIMNHPPTMREKNYRKTSYKLHTAIKSVATKEGCMEIIASDNNITDGIHETAVSVDGIWQRKRFSSLNGAVAALSIQTGKVLLHFHGTVRPASTLENWRKVILPCLKN